MFGRVHSRLWIQGEAKITPTPDSLLPSHNLKASGIKSDLCELYKSQILLRLSLRIRLTELKLIQYNTTAPTDRDADTGYMFRLLLTLRSF